MLAVKEAINLILENTPDKVDLSQKELLEAKGFILAEKIIADRDYPPFNRATMDGYALNFSDLEKGNKFNIIGGIFAGDNWKKPKSIKRFSTVKIMTGSPVPECFDVVIKKEDTKVKGKTITVQGKNFTPWLNIARQGEDATKGMVVGRQGSLIDESMLTVAASLGYNDLYVSSPPRVSLISTGNEIIPIGLTALPNQIRDSNSVTIRSMLNKFNIRLKRHWLIPDNQRVIEETISKCLRSDICIITGGVSAGDADYIPKVLKKMGVKEVFHKVMIRPGKPIWFGKNEQTLFFGLPGNPVSARITFKVFVEPCIRKFIHVPEQSGYFLPLFESRTKKHNFTEYFRVKIVNRDNQSYLQEIPSNGSGDFISSIDTIGVAIHPADKNELPKNSHVEFLFW